MKLDKSLQHPMHGLINLQNKDNECFRWCHIRHLNPQDKDPQRIKKEDRKMVGKLNYEGIEFPVRIKDVSKIEKQISIRISVFGHSGGKNPEEPDKHIMYLDANNLYGWAMSQNLPTGGFRWITTKKKIELERVSENIGLILEVDLEYPKELHDLHSGYPLAPEKMTITEDMLSWYCNEIKDKFNLTVGNVQKLVTTLSGKKNYVVHYKNLILYEKLGLKVTKVHRVLKFDQSPWLRE